MSHREHAATARSWLFVPGDRPERFEKAVASGADQVILDLEDAVAEAARPQARAEVATWLGEGSAWVRVNGSDTPAHQIDLDAVAGRPGLRGVVLAKAEDPSAVRALREHLPADRGIVALIESARGLSRIDALAAAGVDRLAFGSVDFALDIGADHDERALLFARSSLVVAGRTAGLPGPIDGVSTAVRDAEATAASAHAARSLGFTGKLCIHPAQVAWVHGAFAPGEAELAWARRIVEAAEAADGGAVSVDGEMVDAPVLARARVLLDRAHP